MTTNETLIKVEDLKKSFGKIDVLKGISTEITKGEVVCIIGPSGSGKSTFLRCLNLLEEPTGGHIYFDNTDITAGDYKKRKTAIKYMLENGTNIASFLIISGDDSYEDFIPNEQFFEDLRKKYYSYDESGKSDK